MKAGPVLETVLYAEDLEAARGFYGAALGLDEHSHVTGRFVFYRAGQQMLLIFNPNSTRAQSAASAPPAHGTSGNGHVCFTATLEEIDRWREHLAAKGFAAERVIDWPGGGRSLYVRDPAGNSVEFAEPRIWNLPEQRSLRNRRIAIATHNEGKLAEFAALLMPHGADVVSAREIGLSEPEETESTFAGNARIKALHAMKTSGLIALSDDSGLCVDALGGEPGVHTADWAGPSRDWDRAMRLVEEKLEAKDALAPQDRRATFVAMLCVIWPDGEERFYEGRCSGHLVWPPRGKLGHGYDPMFVADGEKETFAELEPARKNRISHRARAFERLVRDLF